MKPSKYFLSAIFLFLFYSSTFPAAIPQVIHNKNLIYLAHTVVVKYKTPSTQKLNKSANIEAVLGGLLQNYNVASVKKTFSANNPEAQKIGLDRIMTITYKKNIDPLYASAKIKELPDIEWAEPKFVREVSFMPNDPNYNSSNQWNLFQINAQAAWDISQGDTSVIIGIVDTGIDWTHPDLAANMWSGIGTDLGGSNGTPDNNPIEDMPAHGTFVAGVASAVTNNAIGISSIGFKCKLMAVKASRADMTDPLGEPYIVYGFEGILYAIDHGAKVINCSWGGGGFSNMEQDVIYYALSKGTLIVAAAGNDGANESIYPASYDGVLSVAATGPNDAKADFSNYGYYVDCSAPGVNIYSTWQTDTYQNGSGTSFSTPLVSGLAGLVFSHFPNYTPLQVAEQIRVNSDNIDLLNPNYPRLLGYGRIDAKNSLTNTNSVSVRAYDFQFTNLSETGNANSNFLPGDKVQIKMKFRNYLGSVSNSSVTLQSLKPDAVVQDGNCTLPSLNTLDSSDNYSTPFAVQIAPNIPYDDTLIFILNYYINGTYHDYQYVLLNVNHSYETENGNNIALTITSRGNLGFNDYPNNLEGEGFRFSGGPNLLFEGSLMFGTSSGNLSDEARNSTGNEKDTSFEIVEPIRIVQPGSKAFQEGSTVFNDNGSGSNALGITTHLHSYSFNDPANKNSIILNYSFTNGTNADINNFYAGIFLDWDLVESSGDSDIVVYDKTGDLGYAYHLGGNPGTYVGTALISSDNYGFWGIENGSSTPFQIYDGFTKSEKWEALSSGIGIDSAGPTDISEVVSAGPFSIGGSKSINVAFALTAGNNLGELRTNMINARNAYSLITSVENQKAPMPLIYSLAQNYPNPFNLGTEIGYEIPKDGIVSLKIYDVLGRLVKTLVNGEMKAGKYKIQFYASDLPSGVYLYRMKTENFSSVKKLILLK